MLNVRRLLEFNAMSIPEVEMTGHFFYPWQCLYVGAFAAGNPRTIRERVKHAERVIRERQRQLEKKATGDAEQHAIRDALFLLTFWRDRNLQPRVSAL